jgi:hypothetical protein
VRLFDFVGIFAGNDHGLRMDAGLTALKREIKLCRQKDNGVMRAGQRMEIESVEGEGFSDLRVRNGRGAKKQEARSKKQEA